MKPIYVTIDARVPTLGMFYEPGRGVIVGYLRVGDYYTTEILNFLGLHNKEPVKTEFEVFIIKRLDKDTAVIVQRNQLGDLVTLENVTDYNEIQNIYQNGPFFDPGLAGIRDSGETEPGEKEKPRRKKRQRKVSAPSQKQLQPKKEERVSQGTKGFF